MGSSVLVVTLTVSLVSLGGLIQTSHSLDNSGLIRKTPSPVRNNNAPVEVEVSFHSESSSDSVEGSGQSVDSTALQKLINQSAILKEHKRVGDGKRSGSGITLTTTPAFMLHHSGARNQDAHRVNTSVTGYTHSSVHIVSEEAPSHITSEEQLKKSITPTANDDFLNGLSPGLDSPKRPLQSSVFTNQNQSGHGGPCMLSLRPCAVLPNFNEFDMRPPSPINLRRSIDNALHHGQLVAGGLFTPPPPSWTYSVDTETNDGSGGAMTLPPAYAGFRWILDTESISASLDHFQAKEPIQSPSATNDYNGSGGSMVTAHQGEELISEIYQHDWSEDDVTDL